MRGILLRLLCLLPACWLAVASAQTRVDRTLSVQPPTTVTIQSPVATPSPPAYQPSAAIRSGPSGSYVAQAMGATILAKNADYETTFRVSLPVPPGASISNVAWKYGLSGKPPGFEAVLCWNNQQRCWNVTNSASGSTSAFNGKDAAQAFTLHYRVKGSGQLGPPLRGEMNQVIVTYDLPG